MDKEKGNASLLISLSDGEISVFHGDDKTLLFKRTARKGDWTSLFSTIYNQLKGG